MKKARPSAIPAAAYSFCAKRIDKRRILWYNNTVNAVGFSDGQKGEAMQWEFRLLDRIQKHQNPFMDLFMPFCTKVGNGGFVWHLLSLLLILPPPTRLAGFCTFFAEIFAAGFANLIVKPAAARIRPCNRRPEVDVRLKKRPKDYSFPSGHSTTSFAGAVGGTVGMALSLGAVAAVVFGVLSVLLAACIAYSRMYLYVHYPTDVLCGVLLGIVFGATVPFGVAALYRILVA